MTEELSNFLKLPASATSPLSFCQDEGLCHITWTVCEVRGSVAEMAVGLGPF